MAELTLYGLPMYRIGGSGIAPPRQARDPGSPGERSVALQAHARRRRRWPRLRRRSRPTRRPACTSSRSPPTAPSARRARDDVARLLLHRHRRPARRALPPDRAEGDQADHDREGARRAADRANSQDVTPLNTSIRSMRGRSSTLASTEPEVGFDDLAFPSKLQSVTTFKRLRDDQAAGRPRPGSVLLRQPDRRPRHRDAASVHPRERRRLQLDQQRLRAAGLLDARRRR